MEGNLIDPDLFEYSKQNAYPVRPGAKRLGTSSDSAIAIAPRAKPLRARVLEALRDLPMTADECAERLGVTVLACRPRFSELLTLNLISDTGKTRLNASGVKATVWQIVA